jgi:hypothetical protein
MKRLALALLLFAGPVWAANSVVIDSIATFTTYHNIGVKIYYTGDDDSDMVVRLGVRHAERLAGVDTITTFRSDKLGANTSDPDWPDEPAGPEVQDLREYVAASVLMCGADSLFHFFLTVTDADGCANCPVDFANPRTPTFMARTKVNNTTASLASLPKGKQIFVGPYGADANNGLDRAHPKLTFASAITAMTTQGDQLRLMSGTYYTMRTDSVYISADSKNGTGSKYYSIVGDTGVVISGADTTALNPAGWVAEDIGRGVIAFTKTFGTALYPRAIVLGDTTRLFPYRSFYRLLSDANGIARQFGAFYCDAGTKVYLRVPARFGTATPGQTLAALGITRVGVPRKNTAMKLGSAFWRVDSLTFRDFGTGDDVRLADPVISLNNQGNVVENCTFMDLGRPSIGVVNYFDVHSRRSGWNTIQNNLFHTHSLGQTWNKEGIYLGFDKMAGLGCVNTAAGDTACLEVNLVYPTILLEVGRGHVIRWNRAVGAGDSFVRWTGFEADTTGERMEDIDVYQNFILNMGDDVIEPDFASNVNTRIYKNIMLGGHTPMNWYVRRGPMYFVFNTCVNQSGLLPTSDDGSYGIQNGHTVIANNTFTTRLTEAAYMWAQPQTHDHDAYVNHVVVNNIINGNTGTIRESGSLGLNEFNWNTTYVNTGSLYSGTQYGTIGRTQNSIQAWRDSTYGYGANDRLTASLEYADSLHWDWSPRSTWADVLGPTKARSFPGVNTNTLLHVSPAWWVNRSGSSDSTYVGAWPVNGWRLESLGEPNTCACRPRPAPPTP